MSTKRVFTKVINGKKMCHVCGLMKPVAAFGYRSPGKIHSWCIPCRAVYMREKRRKKDEHIQDPSQ
jgi:hypothetical protein